MKTLRTLRMFGSGIFFITALTIQSLSAQPSVLQVSGTINDNTTWSHDIIEVLGDVTVPQGISLTILPGTQVIFTGYYALNVYGHIQAVGATSDTIVFTVDDTTGFYANLGDPAGCWRGLYFNGADSSKLIRCKFSYAKETSTSSRAGGALNIYNASLMVRNCHFEHNYSYASGGAVYFYYSNAMTMDSCRLNNNTSGHSGGAIVTTGGDHVIIRDNEVDHNEAAFHGGAIQVYNNSDVLLYRNNIHHNQAYRGGGMYLFSADIDVIENRIHHNHADHVAGGFYGYNTHFKAIGNIIANNRADDFGGGINCSQAIYPLIINNLIVNNYASRGGGVELTSSNAIMNNNTIAYNLTSGDGGGIWILSSSPELQNNIIWSNQPSQVHVHNTLATPIFHYCNIQGGTAGFTGVTFLGEAGNILNQNPLFTSPPGGTGDGFDGFSADWSLDATSPSINGGNPDLTGLNLPEYDVYGNPRIRNSLVDHGAAETHIEVVNVSSDITTDTYWLADTVKVWDNITVQSGQTLTIHPGTVVQFQDYYQLYIAGRIIADGTPADSIQFTVLPENRDEGWNGIYFYQAGISMPATDSSILDHCILEFAQDTNTGGYDVGGALEARYTSKLRISHSSFRYDTANSHGAAIYAHQGDPFIAYNHFAGNYSNQGVVTLIFSKSEIRGNTFVDNSQSALMLHTSNVTIRENFIANNGKGIEFFFSSTKPNYLINNIIVNNDGNAISVWDPDVYVINNTIVNNNGNAIDFNGENLVILNSVFEGNTTDYPYDHESIVIRNCLVDGGMAALFPGSTNGLDTLDIINGTAGFYNQTPGRGKAFPTEIEDWNIHAVSPVVNQGLNAYGSLDFPERDIAGNPRVNIEIIDIGAYENQSPMLAITRQPQNSINCEGENLTLSVTASDTAHFQWLKDGAVLPGETGPELQFGELTTSDQANYVCLVTNGYGTVESNPAYLLVNENAEFLSEGGTEWIRSGENAVIDYFYKGSNPTFSWMKDGQLINDEFLPQLEVAVADSSQEGLYQAVISNTCSTDTSDATSLFLAPQICMVTVDTTGYNLVVWEKASRAPVLSYNVYRESAAAGIYTLLKSVAADELSVFVDTAADPTVQPYLYKLTAVDTGGIETDIDLCKPHKTIHLIVSRDPQSNNTQLQWDKYHGFAYQTYNIYKSTNGVTFDSIYSISASVNSWSDTAVAVEDQYYRIAVQRPVPCYPTSSLKATTGPYTHALSNLDDNKLLQNATPPDTITIDDSTIYENQSPGVMIGKLSTEDADSTDAQTYHLVSGPGDEGNEYFTLAGNLLLSAATFDYETQEAYTIRVRSTDLAGNYIEVIITIHILDLTETGIDGISSPGVIRAYPNPFRSRTTLEFDNAARESYTLRMTDLSGKLVRLREEIRTSKLILEKEDLDKGLYFVELRGPKIFRCRIVIE